MRILLILLIFSVSNLSAADDVSKATSVVNLYGVVFTYGVPPWVTPGDDMLEQMKPFRDQKGRSFVLEFIPADEEFDSWKTMFAVSAYRHNQTAPVQGWRDWSLDTLKNVCSGYRENTLFLEGPVALVQVICPRVVGAPMKGYEGGMGEVGVFAFMVHGNVLINHHIEWRGKAFDADNEATWPVSRTEIDKALKVLKQASAFNEKTIIKFPVD